MKRMQFNLLVSFALIGAVMSQSCNFDDRTAEPKPSFGNRNAVEKNSFYEWPDRIVPVYFEDSLDENSKYDAIDVLMEFRRKMKRLDCDLTFIRADKNSRYKKLQVYNSGNDGCSNSVSGGVGSSDNRVDMSLEMSQNSCGHKGLQDLWKGVFRHELFHVFGITHTQRRSDRDTYITVIEDNISPYHKDQYEKCKFCDESHKLPYECNSIMHYSTGTFARGREPTMESKDERECSSEHLKWGTSVPTENDWKVLKYALKC